MEIQVAGDGCQLAGKLFFLPQHIEMALIGNLPQSMELLHHKLLDSELVDDTFCIDSVCRHALHIEMDVQPIFVF